VKLDPADLVELRPLIVEAVRATVDQIQTDQAKLADRLGYPEPEAARLLGVARHVLRDCRLRGELKGRLVGKKIVYSRAELIRFLEGGK
jgi:Helix-turn-helix domain